MKMNKKGITLVEVIVVLVIMAVLAGILVASYTGYIEKAKKDATLVEARAFYLATMTIYHEEYAKGNADLAEIDEDDDCADTIKTLAGITPDSFKAVFSGSELQTFEFTKDGYLCKYEDDSWTVTKEQD